jgi:hypothetical protein
LRSIVPWLARWDLLVHWWYKAWLMWFRDGTNLWWEARVCW